MHKTLNNDAQNFGDERTKVWWRHKSPEKSAWNSAEHKKFVHEKKYEFCKALNSPDKNGLISV